VISPQSISNLPTAKHVNNSPAPHLIFIIVLEISNKDCKGKTASLSGWFNGCPVQRVWVRFPLVLSVFFVVSKLTLTQTRVVNLTLHINKILKENLKYGYISK
jgi:hypothetical protein